MTVPTRDEVARNLRLYEEPEDDTCLELVQEWLERKAPAIAKMLIAKVQLTFTQPYPGGRILLMLGQHQVGAIFPPPNVTPDWAWRFWLGSLTVTACSNGRAKSEQAAKNALLAAARDWLRKAGLE